MSKLALVIGITGGFGGHVARALRRRGWTLRALMRDPSKLPTDLEGVETVTGDAADADAVRDAMAGAKLVVYGANVPYQRWQREAFALLEVTVAAAEQCGARILFPGNVYNYDPADGPTLAEDAPQHAPTRKGRIRVAMEERLEQAAQNGAKVLVLRCGDYFGTGSPSSWMNEIIKRRRDGGWRFTSPGAPDVPHAFAYLPDVAETAARLLEEADSLGDFEVFHFRGHHATLAELEAALTEVIADDALARGRMPWWLLTLASPFVPMLRELREMRYLWEHDVALDDAKLRAAIGTPPLTPITEALATTLGLPA